MLFLIGGLLSLLMIAFLMLSLPSIQTKLAKKVTDALNKEFLTNFKIDKVAIYINGTIAVKGVYVGDHHGDTLMYANSIATSANGFQKISSGIFDFDALSLSDVNFNIIKYQGEEKDALNVLINSFKRKSVADRKEVFNASIAQLSIENTRFRFIDQNKKTNTSFALDSITLAAEEFNLNGDFFEIKIANLSAKENRTGFTIEQFKGDLSFDPCLFVFSNFKIQSSKNSIEGSVAFNNKSGSFKDFYNSSTLNLSLKKGLIFPKIFDKELKYFPNNNPFQLTFEASGKLNDIHLNTIELEHDFGLYKGAMDLKNLLDKSLPSQFEATMDLFVLDLGKYSDLAKTIKWMNYLKPFDQIVTKGSVSLSNKTLSIATESNSNAGSFLVNATSGLGLFNRADSDADFKGSVVLNDVDISSLLNIKNNWSGFGRLNFEGGINKSEGLNLAWEGTDFGFKNSDHSIDQINFQGVFKDEVFKNTLISNSEILKFKSDERFDFSKDISEFSLAINLIQFDLVGLGFNLGGGKALAKGVILANFEGTNIDDLNGTIKLSSLQLQNEQTSIVFNPIAITQQFNGDFTDLTIKNTDFIQANIKGKYRLSQIKPLFQNAFQEVYSFLPSAYPKQNQFLEFNVQLSRKILEALYPEFSLDKNISLKGMISSEKSNSSFSFNSPFFSFGAYAFENLTVKMDTKNPLYNTYLSFDRFKNPNYNLGKMDLISTSLKDTLFFRSEFNGGKKMEDQFELNFYHVQDADGISYFGLKKSKILYKKKPWLINPSNEIDQKISFNTKTKAIAIPKATLNSNEQGIAISGDYLNPKNTNLKLSLKEVVLEDLLPDIPTFKTAGKANLNFNYIRSIEENSLQLSSTVKDLNLNNQEMGDFSFFVNGNSAVNSYVVELDLEDDSKTILKGVGSVLGYNTPTLDFDLSLNSFNLGFLSALGKKSVSNIRGLVTGNINLWGEIRSLQHTGTLNLKNGGIGIPYLNIDYAFDPVTVSLYDQVFDFGSLKITDTEDRTTGILKGKITHSNFKNWGTDLTIGSDRILILKKPQEEEAIFFGNGYLDGNISLTGLMKSLSITVDGTTEKGTSIKIPWSEDYGISDTSYINFIDKNNVSNQVVSEEDETVNDISGLEMKFDLDVNSDAEIEIVVDQETGSFLNGRGSGNMLMEINTKGKFNMWGDFITFGGVYNFKNLGVIDKKFTVKPGGTIVWEGDPLSAQMNLDAVYEVPGGANPALLLDNPNFNKKIPTEVIIKLQGNLLKPDDPIFEIDFPNTSNTVVSEINYRLSDPQRSQLQALSLLSQGIFISDVGVSMQGITNNLYQKASDVFSSLLGEESDKIKVGVDFLQGDKSATLDIASEDRLGFTLFTQISDRILLNGKIGVPVGGVEETLIVGNVQIDFILNKEGSLKAKVFNKENEFRYLTDELGYTQGLGISYEVDFNTFRELINKITRRAQSKVIINNNLKSYEQTGINFINKN